MSIKKIKTTSFLLTLFLSFILFTLPASAVAVAPDLGSASPYGILGATTTVTSATQVSGSLGSGGATGTAVVTGSTDVANEAYSSAFTDLGAAITDADLQLAAYTPTTSDLGGQTLTPGVYKFTSAISIGSSMTLNGNGVYIFQIGGALTTAANTQIQLSGGAQSCNIFWVTDVATIGANSTFEGTLMSKSAITVGADSVTNGRILAQTAVTADAANTKINVPQACVDFPTPEPEPEPEPTPVPVPTPEPIPVPTPVPTPEPIPVPAPVPTPVITPTPVDSCPSPSVSVLLNSKGDMLIHATLPNDAKGTGTWSFNIGGKTYKVKGNEEITYTAINVPVGTYTVAVKFIPDNNREIVNLTLCTVFVPTVTGGELPETSTPWYNLFLVGAVLTITGIALLIRRKIHAE